MTAIFRMQLLGLWDLAAVLALTVVVGVTNATLLFLLGHSVGGEMRDGISALAWFLPVLTLFLVTQHVLSCRLTERSEQFLKRERVRLMERLLASRLVHAEGLDHARVMSVMMNDTAALSGFLPILVGMVSAAITIVICLGYLAILAPTEFLFVLLLTAMGVGAYSVQSSRARHLLLQAHAHRDSVFGLAEDLLGGLKELKLDQRRREMDFLPRLITDADASCRAGIGGQHVLHGAASLANLAFFAMVAALAFVAPALSGMPGDVRVVFLVVLIYLSGPLARIIGSIPPLASATVSAQRLAALQHELEQMREPAAVLSPRATTAHAWRQLTVRNVTFRHRTQDGAEGFVLGPLNLTFARGEITFIVGSNGVGKSTLAKLLIGLYVAETGTIALDDLSIDDSNRVAFRDIFATVFNPHYLFERLSTGNVAAQERLVAALRHLGYAQDAERLSRGFAYNDLSLGQRRRLALAVAYDDDKAVCLFDEWAADQDPQSRAHFYTVVLPLLKSEGRTVIAISHDDRFFAAADRIVRLDHGRVVENTPRMSTLA